MSFSFSGLFKQGYPESGVALEPPPLQAAQGYSSPTSPMEAHPTAAAPFTPGASLFRTLGGESVNSEPVGGPHSPFSASSAPTTATPLTVGDLLPQLPPELARSSGLDPSQPVAISPDVIENALREGRTEVPMFEVFRVCPALFQYPVSPQDPRTVPLPAAKLPALIAVTSAPDRPQDAPASPFAVANSASAPGQAKPPGNDERSLPPRREGPPPSLAPELPHSKGPAFPLSPFGASQEPRQDEAQEPPPQEAAPPAPPSPFSVFKSPKPPGTFQQPGFDGSSQSSPSFQSSPPQSPEAPNTPAPSSSPFSTAPNSIPSPQNSEPPAMESPFAAQDPAASANPAPQPSPSPFGTPNPSPFAAPQGSAQPQPSASPFQPASPATPPLVQPSAPPQEAPSRSPQESPFAASPFAQSSPPAASPTPAASSEQATVRTGLSGLLQGYSAAELGFDPMMVPSWITVELNTQSIRDKATPNGILVPFGEIMAGLTDSSFRTVLANARQDFLIKLDPAVLGTAPTGPAAHTPPAQSSEPSAPPTGAPQANSFFASPPETPAPAPQTAQQPSAPPSFRIDPSASGQAPMPQMPAMPAFPSAPANGSTPSQPTFKIEPASGFGGETNRSPANPEPKPNLGTPFETPRTPPAPNPQAFDPFAAPASPPSSPAKSENPRTPEPPPSTSSFFPTPEKPAPDGFSSADLLGQAPAKDKSAEPAPDHAWGSPKSEPSRSASPASQAARPSFRPTPHDTRSDQLLLRALLGSSDPDLSPDSIVALTAGLDGVSACVCVRDGQVVAAHSREHDDAGLEFKKQAADLANHVRSLVPIIGIDGAETFTLGAKNRTLTFCFPGDLIVGVLHHSEPTLSLRDKITLIARELEHALS